MEKHEEAQDRGRLLEKEAQDRGRLLEKEEHEEIC
tara:strand:+ start:2342 stop:2446 length:105 start_codon:yes stop_codon:yes gene_type:complete